MDTNTENSTGFAWLDNNSLAEPEDGMKDASSATLTADEILDDISSKPCLCSITVLKMERHIPQEWGRSSNSMYNTEAESFRRIL